MSSSIFAEAVVDAKKLREHAFNAATAAIVERMAPTVRNLIEEQLLAEDDDKPVEKDDDAEDLLLDLVGGEAASGENEDPEPIEVSSDEPAGISLPDPETGEVTINLDSFIVPDEGDVGEAPTGNVELEFTDDPVTLGAGDDADADDEEDDTDDLEFLINQESVRALSRFIKGGAEILDEGSARKRVRALEDRIASWVGLDEASARKSASKIAQTIREVKNMYFCIRESTGIADRARGMLEDRLEECYSTLNRFESVIEDSKSNNSGASDMTKKIRETVEGAECDETTEVEGGAVDEANIEIELTDVDDDVADEVASALDSAGLAATVDEDDEGGEGEEEELDLDFGDEGDDELSDDDVVEIEESVLRREIARARKLNEEGPGGAPGSDEFDDFADAKDEGEPFVDMDDSDLNKNESRRRSARNRRIAERRQQRRAPQSDARSRRIRESRHERQIKALKAERDEANLFAAKLAHANKLLQREGLSNKQKSTIVDTIDNAQSISEVRRLYKGYVRTLAAGKLNESTKQRRVIGSASRPSGRPAKAEKKNENVVVEGHAARWGVLSGIDNK